MGCRVRFYFLFLQHWDYLRLCLFHSKWLLPWILLYCYFRRWHDSPWGNVPWQPKGKRLFLLRNEMEGRKEDDVVYVITARSSPPQPRPKIHCLRLCRPRFLGITGAGPGGAGNTHRTQARKIPFLGFCVNARTVQCLLVFREGKRTLISHAKRSCELFYDGL